MRRVPQRSRLPVQGFASGTIRLPVSPGQDFPAAAVRVRAPSNAHPRALGAGRLRCAVAAPWRRAARGHHHCGRAVEGERARDCPVRPESAAGSHAEVAESDPGPAFRHAARAVECCGPVVRRAVLVVPGWRVVRSALPDRPRVVSRGTLAIQSVSPPRPRWVARGRWTGRNVPPTRSGRVAPGGPVWARLPGKDPARWSGRGPSRRAAGWAPRTGVGWGRSPGRMAVPAAG